MKSKEEPSVNSSRGNPSEQVDLDRSGGVGSETTGSLSRPGRTVTAHTEQPALSLFPMSLMEAVVDPANMAVAWKNVKANRGAPGVWEAELRPVEFASQEQVLGRAGRK